MCANVCSKFSDDDSSASTFHKRGYLRMSGMERGGQVHGDNHGPFLDGQLLVAVPAAAATAKIFSASLSFISKFFERIQQQRASEL